MKSTDMLRKTKIVCTLGPATSSPESIRELLLAGMDVARLNFSHGTHDSHRATITTLRTISAELGREVGILQDLAGPKIRLGELKGEYLLETGKQVVLVSGESQTGDELPVNYPYLLDDVEPGDRILLADGLVELNVVEESNDGLTCRVVVGGSVTSHKGVNLPTSTLRIPAFTEKDRADLEMGLAEGVDFVAMSFVRNENDLAPVRDIINHGPGDPLLIAKIEKPEAVERMNEIVGLVDAIMVARGDLGVEVPMEQVPVIQKRLIAVARRAGRPVITATQMLRSMIDSPRPTRAEANDVANAILDGTDAVMLSEETAVGNYPIAAVRVLDKVARAIEPTMETDRFLHEEPSVLLPATEAGITRAACTLAGDLNPAALVASTTSGSTARLMARYRSPFMVVGLTPSQQTCRQLCLSWGIVPALISHYDSADEMFARARSWMAEKGLAGPDDKLIITAGIPVGVPGTTNLVKVLQMDGQS